MRKHRILALALLALLPSLVRCLPDNGILGEPYVDCGGNRIEVRFDTRNTFRGLVFVEGHLQDPQCRSAPIDENNSVSRNAQIQLGFSQCGINHTRNADPKGVFLSTRLVVAFNPQYLSKFDRVFDVRCFYMEMEQQLERELNVKMGPPVMHTKQVPMPVCRYEVLSGGPTGPPVFYATIGQMVYHKWTCESSEENQFCMLVHSCVVNQGPGGGEQVELLNEQGCARDKYLLQNLDYVSDLMVGKEAHVYKYADKESMFFDCKITLSIKEPGTQFCPIPQCPDPPSLGGGGNSQRRGRRKKLRRRHLEGENGQKTGDGQGAEGLAEQELAVAGAEQTGVHCLSKLGLFSLVPLNIAMCAAAAVLLWDGMKQLRD